MHYSKSSRRHAASIALSDVFTSLFSEAEFVGGGATPRGFYSDFLLEQAIPQDFHVLLQESWKRYCYTDPTCRSTEMTAHNLAEMWRCQSRNVLAESLLTLPNDVVPVFHCGNASGIAPLPHPTSLHELGFVSIVAVFRTTQWLPGLGSIDVLRVCGEVFDEKPEMKRYLKGLAALQKGDDHQIIGPKLGLFSLPKDLLPCWLSSGTAVRRKLMAWWTEQHVKVGCSIVDTGPFVAKRSDGEQEPYQISPRYSLAAEHVALFDTLHKPTLPVAFGEWATFAGNDPLEHLGLYQPPFYLGDQVSTFCTRDQLTTVLTSSLQLIRAMIRILKIEALGCLTVSKQGTKWRPAMSDALAAVGWIIESEELASRGGPLRLEVSLVDRLGSLWPGPFIEVSPAYQGRPATPNGAELLCVRHSIFGSVDRLVALLLERDGGRLPLWIAPEQVRLFPLAAGCLSQVMKVSSRLKEEGFCVSVDSSTASLSTRTRLAWESKVPIIGVIGEREKNKQCIAASFYGDRQQQDVSLDEFIQLLQERMSHEGQ